MPNVVESQQQPRPRRLIRLPEVLVRTGIGRTSWLVAVRAGSAPAPVRIGARAVAWDEAAIEQWIASRPTAN